MPELGGLTISVKTSQFQNTERCKRYTVDFLDFLNSTWHCKFRLFKRKLSKIFRFFRERRSFNQSKCVLCTLEQEYSESFDPGILQFLKSSEFILTWIFVWGKLPPCMFLFRKSTVYRLQLSVFWNCNVFTEIGSPPSSGIDFESWIAEMNGAEQG